MKKGINYLPIGDYIWGSDGSFLKSSKKRIEDFEKNKRINNTIECKLYNKYKDKTLTEFINSISNK